MPNVIAQELAIGMRECMQRCAGCHDPRGAGNGPIAPLLKFAPPDLSVIAKRNDGAFPVAEVHKSIDGQREIAAHGTRDMPLGRPFQRRGFRS